MKVSVIIPTYNEAEDLTKCIESLGCQTESDFEIIVVDDGSTDDTLELLKNLKNSLQKFYFLTQKHRGAGAARNYGSKMANGKVLVFVDADMTFDEKFIENLTAPIIKLGIKGTFSKDEYVSNWENVWARCWNINENWLEKRRHSKDYPDHQSVFRAILKSEFDKVGGFTPGGYDDDWSLSKKLGYEAIAATNAVFFHKNPSKLSEVFRHAKWVGKRKYKMGYIGYFVALVRSSVLFSLIFGLYKAIKFKQPNFLIFKIVYDFGIFLGILDYLISGKSSK